jgi:hypothetical protein
VQEVNLSNQHDEARNERPLIDYWYDNIKESARHVSKITILGRNIAWRNHFELWQIKEFLLLFKLSRNIHVEYSDL